MNIPIWPKQFFLDRIRFDGFSPKRKENVLWKKISSIIRKFLLHTVIMPSTSRRTEANEGAIKIPTVDYCKLTGYEYQKSKRTKWIVYFHGNAAIAEDQEDAKWLSDSFKVNVLSFNYRGTGSSKGSLINLERDLCADGVAAIQYLKDKGVAENDITLYGHSIGGMVAVKSAVYFPECRVMNDRSFYKTSKVLPFTETIAKKLGLEVDVLSSWEKIPERKKLIVHCNQDWIIRKKASLYKASKQSGIEPNRIKLIKKGSNGIRKHMMEFGWFDNKKEIYQPLYNFIHDVIVC